MITDVLALITPSPDLMKSSYLASPTSGQNPTITSLSSPNDDGVQTLVYMKSLQGYPWDWLTVTQSWIRQRLTENIWTDLASGKLKFGLGDRRFPRYITTDPNGTLSIFQWLVQPPESDYLILGANGSPITRNTDNLVRNTFRGPYIGQPTGDLPLGVDWCLDYEWGGRVVNGQLVFSTKETLTHRVGYGRYQWQSFATDGKGSYISTPSQQSLQNKITALPSGGVVPIQKIF